MSPETKKLLEGARRHEPGPDTAAKDRLRRNVLASIATTAGVAATGSASAAGAGPATTAVVAATATSTGMKLGVAGLVIATAGVLTVRGLSSREAPEEVDATEHARPHASPPIAESVEPPPRSVEAPPPPSASTAEVIVAPTARPTATAQVARSSAAVEVAPVTPESLEAERALIASARSKLASGDNAGALRTLGEHATSHPRGALSSERRALMAIAYCNQGAVAEGLNTFPLPADGGDSPLSARVRAACSK